MDLPDGLTQDEFLKTFQSVITKLASRYVFSGYETEDIEQEAFIIAVASLDKYDRGRSLESFLYVHLNNRLKNFKRDNYYRYESGSAETIQNNKRNILDAIDIDELFHIAYGDDVGETAIKQETLDMIDEHLPANMRSDYLKIKNKGKITKSRRLKVMQKIYEIIEGQDEE